MPPRRKGKAAADAPAAPPAEQPAAKKAKTTSASSAYGDGRREIPVIGESVVYIGNGLLSKIPAEITAKESGIKASRFVIISDTNVWPIYGQKLLDAFEAAGKTALAFQVKAGEFSKCRENKAAIEDFMLSHKCQRDTCMLALGGGVVGDLTGYVASTFMRGVPVIQIPTSVMAMVDSSVGGKTAINVPAGKNLIGAFHQPRRVYADMDLLQSLHQREIDEGLAEAIKMGLIRRGSLFDFMEANVDKVRALDKEAVADVVYQAVWLKAEVVALDEKETGLRATLNFGHTIGHAVEGLASPNLLHGECVSIGMVYEAYLARDLNYLPASAVDRIIRVLKSYGLPIDIPSRWLDVPRLMGKMAVDKKNMAGMIRCTILTGVGTSIDNPQPVDKGLIETLLSPAASAASSSASEAAAGGGGGAVPSVVLIGMRGAGKTHLGRAASSALGLSFLDLDELYEERHGKIMETVKSEGWPAFRSREVALLKEALTTRSTGHVIACGGGIVETEAGRAALKAHWPVVQAVKPIQEIETYLGYDQSRPDLGEPPSKAYERRKAWYDECADIDHAAAPKEADYTKSSERLVARLKRVLGVGGGAPSPMPQPHSFFLSLTYPDLAAVTPLPAALWNNTDAVELRADLLSSLEPTNMRTQIALLRASCPIPIIFTIRSKAEGGAFNGTNAEYLALNTAALKAGVDWIDLESARDDAELQAVLSHAKKLGVRSIGSYHFLGPMKPSKEIGDALVRCKLGGKADVAKYVGVASEPAHGLHVHHAALAADLGGTPYIALAMGPLGRMSRVLNPVYSPVTHPLLPSAGAPGQMSASQVIEARRALGYLPCKDFYIFGTPTKYSPSPSMHNAGFAANGHDHKYGVCETDDVEVVLSTLRKSGAGGGSVTIPLKEKLMPHVTSLSPSAKAIGSLNTLTVMADGSLAADNTDWIGIRNLLADALAKAGKRTGDSGGGGQLTALVMGGGGTARAACYALNDLGVGSLHIYNRTTEKAADLASEFGGHVLPALEEGAAGLKRLDLVVSCVPATAGLTLSVPLLQRMQPIVLDAAYRPRQTPLLTDGAAAGCVCVEGVEMLFEQGCAQCTIWTGRAAPRRQIAEGMAAFLASQDFGALPNLLVEAMKS